MFDRLLKAVMILSLCVICGFVVTLTYKHIQPKSPKLAEAEEEQKIANIFFYGAAKQVLFVSISSVILLSVLIMSYAYSRAKIKQASVYTYKIGKYNEVVVHEKDLSIAAPIAMGLMNAEQLKQMNGGVERAFELYTRMAEVQSKQIQALVGRLAPGRPIRLQARESTELPASRRKNVPTFRELLLSREIAFGKPMILGYENGLPRHGSFMDIYSAAVAGESGSGKTATLLFLIGSGLVSCSVRFLGIDPHYPHPKSLGFKTKPLWEAGLMKMATYKDDMLALLHDVERTLDRRLQQIDKDSTPVVLVIDELAFLAKSSIGKAIAHTMERVSIEGRKCAVYMLASSQTWLAVRTGASSVVRDTLTSAFVHRIKPKQANLLLQDKEEADKVKKHVKHPGDVLLCPVSDDSVVCKIPFTAQADMNIVVEILGKAPVEDVPQKALQSAGSIASDEIDKEFQTLFADFEPAALPEARPPVPPLTANRTPSPESCQAEREILDWSLRDVA